jgi:hypothetical protein
MHEERIRAFQGRLKQASTFEERRAVVRQAAAELDSLEDDDFEVVAARFSEQTEDTIDFARESLQDRELGRETRFLIFTMGAIACRRRTDRTSAKGLFGGVGREFEDIPLFKHLHALSYEGGRLADLRQGLQLEREAYQALKPHGGAAHAIATFIVQIVEQSEHPSDERDELLREALERVEEAIGRRRDYAKFYFTKGRIHRQRGEWKDAREALTEAVERENRGSVDAPDRLRDYRLELSLVAVDQTMRRLNEEAKEATKAAAERAEQADADVKMLEKEVDKAVMRLEGAQVSVITAVAFVASAIGLVQVTVRGFGARPFYEAIALVAVFAVVLFGATAVGARLLRRR